MLVAEMLMLSPIKTFQSVVAKVALHASMQLSSMIDLMIFFRFVFLCRVMYVGTI